MAFDGDLDRRLARLTDVSEAISRASISVIALEDRALAALYEDAPDNPAAILIALSGHDLQRLLLSLYCLRHPKPDQVFLAVAGTHLSTIARLATAYLDVLAKIGHSAKLHWYRTDARGIHCHTAESPLDFLADPDARAFVIGLEIEGPGALPRFMPEAGGHDFEESSRSVGCLVETSPAMSDFNPLLAGAATEMCRIYHMDRQIAEEKSPRREFRWTGRRFEEALAEAVEERLRSTLGAMVGERTI